MVSKKDARKFQGNLTDAAKLLEELSIKVPQERSDAIHAALQQFDKETSVPVEDLIETFQKNLRGHPDLLRRFSIYFPDEFQSRLVVENGSNGGKERKRKLDGNQRNRGAKQETFRELKRNLTEQQKLKFEEATNFFKTAEQSIKTPEVLQTFQKCLESYNSREINLTTLLQKVGCLFNTSQHLLPLFIEFVVTDPQVKDAEKTLASFKRSYLANVHTQNVENLTNHHLKFLRKLKSRVNNISSYERVKRLLVLFNTKLVFLAQIKSMIYIALREEPAATKEVIDDLFDSLEKLPTDENIDRSKIKRELQSLKTSREAYNKSPTHALNVNQLEPCTTSYAFLPLDYPLPKASGRTKLGDSVLNDRVIITSTGSENSNSDLRKTVYENRIFDLDDQISDSAHTMDCMFSTFEVLAKQWNALRELSKEEAVTFVNGNLKLKAFHKRCLTDIFGSDVDKMIQEMISNPKQGIATVAQAVNDYIKDKEAKAKSDVKRWRSGFKENFLKSLDHTSQTFRSMERHHLNQLTFLSEINSAAKSSKKFKAGNNTILVDFKAISTEPHLIFDLSNSEIMETCVWAVNLGIKNLCPRAEMQDALYLWENFFIQFFRLSSQTTSTTLTPEFQSFSLCERMSNIGNSISQNFAPDPKNSEPASLEYACAYFTRKEKLKESIFYCNDAHYCFLRYFALLYIRFKTIWKSSSKQSGWLESIKALILEFLRKDMHPEEFEDALTQRLGTQAYVLFTISLLLEKLVKPMKTLLTLPVLQLLEQKAKSAMMNPRQKGIMNEMVYLVEMKELCPRKNVFRVSYDHQTLQLKIREVNEEIKFLPDSLKTSTSEAKARSRKTRRKPLFLGRNLRSSCFNEMNKWSDRQWPKFVISNRLDLIVDGNEIDYQSGTEDSMVALDRKPPNTELIEKKSSKVSNWVKICCSEKKRY